MHRAIAAAALGLVLGQPGTQPYLGVWTAEHAGQTYVRLELTTTRGTLGGRISMGDIHVNSDGEVEAVVKAATNFTPIFDVVLRDATLSFARKDGDDIDRFEMRLVNEAAQLTFAPSEADREELVRAGVPLPKPFALKKSAR